jgi:ammonia channel protein AmtB
LLMLTLAVSDLLWLHMSFSIAFSISVNNVIGISIRIALNLYIMLSSMGSEIQLIVHK